MRSNPLSTCALICALALVGLTVTATPAVCAASQWKTVAASGQVEAARPRAVPAATWTKVRRGDRLDVMTAVRTGEQGQATMIRNRDILTVSPRSELRLPAEDHVVQRSGRVVYEIDGKTKPRGFAVETPFLVAGVKGTVFMVSVTERYASVSVDEGVVQVMDPLTGKQRDVQAGETVIVDPEVGEMELVRHDGRVDRKSNTQQTRADHAATTEAAELSQALQFRDRHVSTTTDAAPGLVATLDDARPSQQRPDVATDRPMVGSTDLLDSTDALMDRDDLDGKGNTLTDTMDPSDTKGASDSQDSLDSLDSLDTLDTLDSLDNLDTGFDLAGGAEISGDRGDQDEGDEESEMLDELFQDLDILISDPGRRRVDTAPAPDGGKRKKTSPGGGGGGRPDLETDNPGNGGTLGEGNGGGDLFMDFGTSQNNPSSSSPLVFAIRERPGLRIWLMDDRREAVREQRREASREN